MPKSWNMEISGSMIRLSWAFELEDVHATPLQISCFCCNHADVGLTLSNTPEVRPRGLDPQILEQSILWSNSQPHLSLLILAPSSRFRLASFCRRALDHPKLSSLLAKHRPADPRDVNRHPAPPRDTADECSSAASGRSSDCSVFLRRRPLHTSETQSCVEGFGASACDSSRLKASRAGFCACSSLTFRRQAREPWCPRPMLPHKQLIFPM